MKLRNWKHALAMVGLAIVAVSCSKMLNHTVAPDTADSTGRGLNRPPAQPERLASDPRQAIVLECFYALDPGHYGRSSKMIGGTHVSDWRYLYSDQNAYNIMKSAYGCNASVVGGGCWSGPFYTNLYGYSLYSYPGVGEVGHGGQCRFFANLILFRSETFWDNNRTLLRYKDYIYDYNYGGRRMTKPIGQVQVGDVIQTKWEHGHTAIVVQIISRDAAGNATSVDVIDSNYVGGAGNEIIGRHVTSDLGNYIALKLNYR